MSTIEYIEDVFKKHHHQLIHASNILKKLHEGNSSKSKAIGALAKVYAKYIKSQLALKGWDKDVINKRVELLNEYYQFYDHSEYDYNKLFTSQGKLRPTILEEFMFILFKDYLDDIRKKVDDHDANLGLGSTKAYTHLYFSPLNIKSFVQNPSIRVNVKDQDFAIFRDVRFAVGKFPQNTTEFVAKVPIVAAEVKTYLDKTMLEGVIATADKLKMGNPYARFIVVTESYQVGLGVDPSYSQIDQIYVLRKCGATRNMTQIPVIQPDVVYRMFLETQEHIEKPWSDVQTKLENDGVIL